MKNGIIVLLILCLLFMLVPSAWGAIYPSSKQKMDTWYSIEPDAPFAQLNYYNYDLNGTSNSYKILGEYYQNDQTFIQVTDSENFDNTARFSGSYLFDFGLFLGLDYQHAKSGWSTATANLTVISPGFRWNLDEKDSFIAISADYASLTTSYGDSESEMIAYELNTKYYAENLKFIGQCLIPKDDDIALSLTLDYKMSDSLVTGGGVAINGATTDISAGLTYTQDSYIIDAEIFAPNHSDSSINLSGMIQLTDGFYAGAGASKAGSHDPFYYAKARYGRNQTTFLFEYVFANSAITPKLMISYQQNF